MGEQFLAYKVGSIEIGALHSVFSQERKLKMQNICGGGKGRQMNGVNEEQMPCHVLFCFAFFAGCEIACWLLNSF